jgi:hypothetical protein
MKKSLFFIILILLAHFVLAANNYVVEEQKEYMGGIKTLGDLTGTFIWSSVYLLIYTASIGVPLSYLKYYVSLDADMIKWVLFTWVGGLIINAFAYKFIHLPFLGVAFIALPFIFGLAFFINWRNDVTVEDSLKVAGVTAILCAPYFGPTWRM